LTNPNVAIFNLHWAFWGAFGLTRMFLRLRDRKAVGATEASPAPQHEASAPYSRALLIFHGLAFAVMYIGMGYAANSGFVPTWFPGQRIVGSLVIGLGAALVSWALFSFRSWRFRAAVDRDHQLATAGPFQIIRHPIYMGLNLLALGTAFWMPTLIVWAGFVLMTIGSDLRARAEEAVLTRAFGSSYLDYCARTSRFVPGIY
jgi:protein-S-isoprenylcysteine O-methyltransferase Ste14